MVAALEPTDVEQRLIDAVAAGEWLDLTTGDEEQDDPANGAQWGDDRTISAELIRTLAIGAREDWPVHAHGVQLMGAKITGPLDFRSATVAVPLWLVGCYVKQSIILVDARTRTISLQGSRVAGIDADGVRIEGDLNLREGFHASGEVRLLGAQLDGSFDCSGGRFEHTGGYALNADRMRVTVSVVLSDGFHATGEVRLRSAQISGGLTCIGGRFEHGAREDAPTEERYALRMQTARVEGAFFFRNLVVEGHVDLTRAQVGVLADGADAWPRGEHRVQLDGFKYDVIAGTGAPVDAPTRIEWLRRMPPDRYWPQPYEQLAAVLERMGHGADARQIRIEQQRARRRQGGLRWHQRAWSWVQDVTVRYGWNPWRALVPALFVVLLGFGVFWWAGQRGVMRPLLTGDFVAFQSFVYSLDTFVPFVDLHQETHWLPDSSVEGGLRVRVYLWVHIVLGWALSGLIVLAFGGFIRRR